MTRQKQRAVYRPTQVPSAAPAWPTRQPTDHAMRDVALQPPEDGRVDQEEAGDHAKENARHAVSKGHPAEGEDVVAVVDGEPERRVGLRLPVHCLGQDSRPEQQQQRRHENEHQLGRHGEFEDSQMLHQVSILNKSLEVPRDREECPDGKHDDEPVQEAAVVHWPPREHLGRRGVAKVGVGRAPPLGVGALNRGRLVAGTPAHAAEDTA